MNKLSETYGLQSRYGRLLYERTAGSSGTLSLPNFGRNYYLRITGVGAGGGGSSGGQYSGDTSLKNGGGGGASGSWAQGFIVETQGNHDVDWSIGSGGLGGAATANEGNNGNPGGDTIFGDYITLKGGIGATSPTQLSDVLSPGFFIWFSGFGGLAPQPDPGKLGIRFANNQLKVKMQGGTLQERIPENMFAGSLGSGYVGGQGSSTDPIVSSIQPKRGVDYRLPTIGGNPYTGGTAGAGGGAASPWGNGGNATSGTGENGYGFGAGGAGGNGSAGNLSDGGDGSSGFLLVEYTLEVPLFSYHLINHSVGPYS